MNEVYIRIIDKEIRRLESNKKFSDSDGIDARSYNAALDMSIEYWKNQRKLIPTE